MEWRSIAIKNQKISQRENSSICLAKDKLYLFGGAIDSVFFNQLFCYDLATQEWLEVQTTGECPAPRELSIMKYCKQTNAIYLYGGEQLLDIYVLDLNTHHWMFQSTLPLILSEMYFSNQMHVAYPYLYLPSNSHSVSNGVYRYSLPQKQWKFLPFNHILYLEIDNTAIINGYLYIFGQKLQNDYAHNIWRCNLNPKNQQLQLELSCFNRFKTIKEMNFISLCAYKDRLFLFSSGKTNQIAVVGSSLYYWNTYIVSGQAFRLNANSTCMVGNCLISLNQSQNNAKLLYITLYEKPVISKTSFYPILVGFYPNIKVTINGMAFFSSRQRLAENSKLFSMLISRHPEEIELNIMQVSKMAIGKMMANLSEEYFGQKIYNMGTRERYEYLIELAYLAQYFVCEGLTDEVDHRLCNCVDSFDAAGTIEIIRLAESLDLVLFAELNALMLIRRYILNNRIGELLVLTQSKILRRMIEEHKFDLVHRCSSQSFGNCS